MVDFSVMVFLVQVAGVAAALAAVGGASVGAVVNFQLGRRWIFGATQGRVAGQALRYAMVSAASAALNGVGELILHHIVGVHYFAARCVVAVLVSLSWNLPMQRHFVFGGAEGADAAKAGS